MTQRKDWNPRTSDEFQFINQCLNFHCFAVKAPRVSFLPNDPQNNKKRGLPYHFSFNRIHQKIPRTKQTKNRPRKNPTPAKSSWDWLPKYLSTSTFQKKMIHGYLIFQINGASIHFNPFSTLKIIMVRIVQHRGNHPKAITIGGTFIFHNLCKGLIKVEFLAAAIKNEVAEKVPSLETIYAWTSSPSSGMLSLLILSRREKRLIFFNSIKFLLKAVLHCIRLSFLSKLMKGDRIACN